MCCIDAVFASLLAKACSTRDASVAVAFSIFTGVAAVAGSAGCSAGLLPVCCIDAVFASLLAKACSTGDASAAVAGSAG